MKVTRKAGIITVAAVLIASLLGYVFYFPVIFQKSVASNERSPQAATQPYKVAIVVPTTHQSLITITEGFINALKDKINLDHRVFNAQGNRALLKSQMHEIIQGRYDLIVTVGAMATLMAKESLAQQKASIPIVFAAVSDPIRRGIVSSEGTRAEDITGVSEQRDYKRQIELLLFLKPTTKTILLVYDPTQGGGLDAERDKLAALCYQKGIEFKSVAVSHAGEIYSKVSPLITSADTIFVLKDNTVVSGIESLVGLCDRFGATLYVSNLESVDAGAALGYGTHEQDFGIQAAQKAYQILVDHEKASSIPVSSPVSFYIKVNSKHAALQNLKIESRLMELITHGEVV
jgi:putative tryptophan/tyrosine transport system substrate-binding protein